MKFKIDSNLKKVVAGMVAPVDPEIVSVELCARFVNAGMIENEPFNYGETAIRALRDEFVRDICALLAEYLYGDPKHSINCDVFNAFCQLVIMGDGNCPNCGGELKYIETEGHELNDGDYYTPNSVVTDNYVYRCTECGETIKSENEL